MKLNIILITYKQEQYISQTLDSILLQNADFDYNIIVADDSSPDATLDIIKEYAEKSEIEFKFLPQTTNLGFVKNYQRAFKACDAEYIAIMEGDDYWVKANHLENHVQFLDNHEDCSMSFNRHIRLFQAPDGTTREEVFEWTIDKDYELLQTEDQIYINKIGNLSCCVFRNKYIQSLEPEVFENDFADWLLGMIMGQYGFLARQKDVTSAYRIHENGQWTQLSDREQDKDILGKIDLYDKILDYKYTKEFAQLKKWKTINVYGDKSARGRIKKLTPSFIRKLYRKISK